MPPLDFADDRSPVFLIGHVMPQIDRHATGPIYRSGVRVAAGIVDVADDDGGALARKVSAQAAPIPDAPPVTSAIFPSTWPIAHSPLIVIPAKAGTHRSAGELVDKWVPASAGMTPSST